MFPRQPPTEIPERLSEDWILTATFRAPGVIGLRHSLEIRIFKSPQVMLICGRYCDPRAESVPA